MEKGRPESKQRFVSPVEDVVESTVTISKLSGEIIDDVEGKSPRTPTNRSPDERVNRKVKGAVLTSTMPNKSSPRRYQQPKELKTQNTRFEIPSNTGVVLETSDDSMETNRPTITLSTDHEFEIFQPTTFAKVPHPSPRPPSPQPPRPEVLNAPGDEEALDFSRHHDESEAAIQTTSEEIPSLYLQKNDDEKNDVFPTTLSLEEYQQRGKPRKTTPKSAVKDSLKFEQRFSRMKSAPQRSPPSLRKSNLRESGEVFNPTLVNDSNRRPLFYSESPALPLGLERKEQNISTPVPSSAKQLIEEEKRIKTNIWNNPLSPLPKIGVLKQMSDQTAITELVDGCNDDKTGTYTYISMAKKPLSSFIKESLLKEHNHPVNTKACVQGSMLETPLMTNAIVTNASDDQLEGIPSNAPFSNKNNLVSSGSATKVESNTVLGGVEVDIRPGGLTYFFTSSHEKHETKWLLPSCLQCRKDRSHEQVQEIRYNLELKNTLMKTNLEKRELARKKKRDFFEARHEAVQQRCLELLDNRQLKLNFSMKCKQVKAKHNKEVIRKKRQDRFRLVQERRNMLRMRKKVFREIRKSEPMEETATDLEARKSDENPNLPAEDIEVQDEQVEEQNKESEDDVILDQAEGEDRCKEDGDGVSHDGEGETKDDAERQVGDGEDDRRMDETDNGNYGNGCDTENSHTEDGRSNLVEAAESTVDGDSNNSENITENHQIVVSGSSQEDAAHRRVDEDSNNSEYDREREHIVVISGSLVDDGIYPGVPLRGGEAYENVRAVLELEAQYQIDSQNELESIQSSSSERRDNHVEALSYFMVAIRALQDEIGDLTARRIDGTPSAGLLPILFEESQPAQGDYYDEGDETTSDTDDEYYESGVQEFVDTVPVEREIFREDENGGSRRRRSNTRGH